MEFIYAHADENVFKWGELPLDHPFSIRLHFEFAKSLKNIGCGGAALLHFKQAVLISDNVAFEITDDDTIILNEIYGILDESSLEEEPYFVSFPCDEPFSGHSGWRVVTVTRNLIFPISEVSVSR